MNQDQILQEVLEITGRPDQEAVTKAAIRATILKAHTRDFYYKDLVETGIKFARPAIIQNFDPKAIFPRFRKIKYIRRWLYDEGSSSLGAPGAMLEPIEIRQVLDDFGSQRTDVYYMAGKLLQMRSMSGIQYCLAGAYVYPDVSINNTDSWICQEYPYYIIYEAAATVLAKTGKDKEASFQKGLANEFYEIMIGDSNNMPGE